MKSIKNGREITKNQCLYSKNVEWFWRKYKTILGMGNEGKTRNKKKIEMVWDENPEGNCSNEYFKGRMKLMSGSLIGKEGNSSSKYF